MVIEVSKEVDCVRVGIDKYSVRTGLKFRSIMVVSTRVLKEPRGFIRIIQCILAILAFSTTAAFSTTCSFSIKCNTETAEHVSYGFGYPFRFRDNILELPDDCEDNHENNGGDDNNENDNDDDDAIKLLLPFDFSSSASFYVATGVISFLYTIIILLVYIVFHQQYANDPKIPVLDLGVTALLSVFWLAGSSAWAQGVADLKYYLHPDVLFGIFPQCHSHEDDDNCKVIAEGQYATLNVSLVLGFACFLIWTASMWFIYKETVFHTPVETVPDPSQNQTAKSDGRV